MSPRKPCLRIINITLKQRGKRGKLTCSKQAQPILVNGLEGSEMASAYRCGPMEPGMKASGRTTELMVMADLFILMGMSMKETGSTTRQMGLGCIFM